MSSNTYLIGYDIGTSSVKATIIDAETGEIIASDNSPKTEYEIIAKNPGWAEQNPGVWWEHTVKVTQQVLKKVDDIKKIKAIGISYQMHGLVMVDKNKEVIHPSIIWCDSRAVEIGNKAFREIGSGKCLEHLLNSPGNFTASKLKWVKENLGEVYEKIHKIMLPGDYIAMKMSGDITTTITGLSEGIFWDFKENSLADIVFDHYGISKDMIPDIVPEFGNQCELSKKAAEELGLSPGIKITYRAGDQPNNAFSLNVLNPGEVAATAGTSGVIYGITDVAGYDKKSRVNTFVHVNNTDNSSRYGILLCVNGTGILNSWTKNQLLMNTVSYKEMDQLAASVPVGSEGLMIFPYGNGAERLLENRDVKASVHGLAFNIHTKAHFLRAVQEGIVFALNYGLSVMKNMGLKQITRIRAGNSNMFFSPVFREAFACITDSSIELYNTDGSQGAARGAGYGAGIYKSFNETFNNLKVIQQIDPDKTLQSSYQEAYEKWKTKLEDL